MKFVCFFHIEKQLISPKIGMNGDKYTASLRLGQVKFIG